MHTFKDQMGRTIQLDFPPRCIVSLVPSQTELLAYLELEEHVLGITKFCVHPEQWFRKKTRVGGTKQLHLDRIEALAPDLIIGNKEENEQSQIEQLAQKYPVWMSDIQSLEDALEMIATIGKMTNVKEKTDTLINEIKQAFDQFYEQQLPRLKAAYFIWKEPYMVAGGDTFISDMMNWAGFENVFASQNRYPTIALEQLAEKETEIILLSSEPFPFKNQHKKDIQKMFRGKKILLVDGEIFSWYGSRLLKAPNYFEQIRRQC